jgi:serine/threonine-protein kinase
VTRRYQVLQVLGGGGMGEVVKAHDRLLDRIVAIKYLRGAHSEPLAFSRIVREARAAARVSHPNIVMVYDIYDGEETGGPPFFTMELIDGIDLQRLVRHKGPLTVWEAREYIRMAALGLQHAHEKGLVHRDMKPSNLMLSSPDSIIKILDMGLARLLSSNPSPRSDVPRRALGHVHRMSSWEGPSPDTLLGTPAFMAPEQQTTANVDIRADIYALGCTFYFLLTSRRPFEGSDRETLAAHREREPTPIEHLRPDVPRNVAAIIRKMMAKRPEDRYQTPLEVSAALARLSQPPLPPPKSGVLDTPESLVATLRQHQLLEPKQLDEIEVDILSRSQSLHSLLSDIRSRGWLTDYQCDELLKGCGAALALGPYILLSPLGEGNYGRVFKAKPRLQGRMVAIKIMRLERAVEPDVVSRFRREIVLSSQLAHPNVALVFSADEIEGRLFFVMEFCEGEDLSRVCRRRHPIPIQEVHDWMCQAACGLDHVHRAGMVHRDIKPANLCLTSDGKVVKILDLGLARLVQGAATDLSSINLTKTGIGLGTPDFIAPEQAQDASAVDIRADLYSLGCTFYYLLTGSVPFPASNALQTALAHLTQPAPQVERLRVEVPPKIAAIVRKLMEKRPEDRYQTPAELLHDLRGAEPGDQA